MIRSCQFIICALLVGLAALPGCARRDYRLWADRDATHLINSRQVCDNWKIPGRNLEAAAHSRMADPSDPDCSMLPPDDPTAACYTNHPYRSARPSYWDQFQKSDRIETSNWRDYLPYGPDGRIKLTRGMANEMGLVHSRLYQDEVESLYIDALVLSANRFEFELNWFGTSQNDYAATGNDPTNTNDLTSSNRLGFSRNLAIGGQFVTSLANSYSWEFNGGNVSTAGGSFLFSLTQPLLRGAFRHVRLETLTQAERTLLYAVRDFARFRRLFYLDVSRDYLRLLSTIQQRNNQASNSENLKRNLAEHRELERLELVTPIQTDQVYQDFQSARQSEFQAEQDVDRAMDNFKFRLGLPYDVGVDLDEGILEEFHLSDPRIDEIESKIEQVNSELNQYLEPEKPTREQVIQWLDELVQIHASISDYLPVVEKEYKQWQQRFAERQSSTDGEDDSEQSEIRTIEDDLVAIATGLTADKTMLDQLVQNGNEIEFEELWNSFQKLSEQEVPSRLADLYTAQLKIRLFLIEITPVEISSETAVQVAWCNRLDLKNQKAAVSDAFRAMEVAADALQASLDVSAEAALGTDSNRTNPLRFDASENIYRLSIDFDSPLNRMTERNAYRVAQIAYQQARRRYMAVKDLIANDVRQDLRELRTNAFNFEIAKLQLLSAVRQVDLAQTNLREASDGDSSLTQDLLRAYQQLLNAKNQLISNWVNYEISRIQLSVDLDVLLLDENGVWINADDTIVMDNSPQLDALSPVPVAPGVIE